MKTTGVFAVFRASAHTITPDELRPRLSIANRLARLALIGLALTAVAGTFAYLGGWLNANRVTPARFVDTLRAAGCRGSTTPSLI